MKLQHQQKPKPKPAKPKFIFGIIAGLAAGALLFALNSFAFHGNPIQRIEGLHAEVDVIADGTQHPVLMGGDDGTNLRNVLVDSGGRIQVDLVTATVDLGSNNDVVATAGLLFGNSPTTLEGTTLLFNAGTIAATQMGASTAVTVSGTGTITQVCVVYTTGTITNAQDQSVIFFEADPTITENTADMTQAEALLVVAKVDFVAADFELQFATAQVACKETAAPYIAVTHALILISGAGSMSDEIINMRFWYRRDS